VFVLLVAHNLKEHPVLFECVIGALGLAIERSVFASSAYRQPEPIEARIFRLKENVRRRLAALAELSRRIEKNRNRLVAEDVAEVRECLQKALLRREAAYQGGLEQIRRARRQLVRLEQAARTRNAAAGVSR
jgi:hypothetical protein